MNNINIDGPILKQVFNNSKMDQNQKNSNLNNAKRMFARIPNRFNDFSSNVGLVVGKVQSGKTANIITLSALALDNGHRFIVMMLSDTNNLLDQNYERIKNSFANIDDVIVIKESIDGKFGQLGFDTLNKLYRSGKKIIVCSLKHYKHINNITKVIKGTKFKDDYSIIIDDEGDDISQNTSRNKFLLNSDGNIVENERSKNNSEIVKLKSLFSKCGYISVTATPEAPIFLQTFQTLSPNYCITLQPGVGYVGLTTFHDSNSKLVEIIDDYDCLIKDNGVPNSLIDAVQFFFAGCIYRCKSEDRMIIHSMMIHPSKTIVSHDTVYSKLKQRLKLIERSIKHNDQSGKDFFEGVNNHYKSISSTNDDINMNDLLYVFDNYNLNSINRNAVEKDINSLTNILPFNIVIGGDLLDRGITIPNLAVSYIIRDSKIGQVDTLLQRARWFGYKQDYIETCKVYMPSSLADKYNEMIEVEDSLWDFLEECSEMEYDLKDCNVSLSINSSILNPTSSSKASFEFSYSNIKSVKQQKNFTINLEQNNDNLLLVRTYHWENAHILKYNKVQKHRYIDLNISEFDDFVSNYNFSDYNNDDSSLNKDLLIKLVHENIEQYGNTVSLVDMRYDTGEERTIYNDNCVRNLMQGRSEGKSYDDPDYYPGDRYLPEFKNRISIQIHHVIIKDNNNNYYINGDNVILIVLCMPKDFIIRNFVTRKDIANIDRIYA